MEDSGYAHLTRCFELQESDVAGAAGDREATRKLILHLAAVSAPGTGAAKALLVYARLATSACEWLDGDLRVDLVREGRTTVVEAFTDLGGGLRERLFPPTRFSAPLEEFARAIARVPQMIAPLQQRTSTPGRIVLTAREAIRRTTAPPPPITIADESLFVLRVGAPQPHVPDRSDDPAPEGSPKPKDIDGDWDD